MCQCGYGKHMHLLHRQFCLLADTLYINLDNVPVLEGQRKHLKLHLNYHVELLALGVINGSHFVLDMLMSGTNNCTVQLFSC